MIKEKSNIMHIHVEIIIWQRSTCFKVVDNNTTSRGMRGKHAFKIT